MRKPIALLAVVAVSGAAAATADAGKTKRIVVGDNYFHQTSGVPKVKVKRGTTVKWVWKGSSSHNVRVAKGPVKFGSKFMTSGTYKRKMTRKGKYLLVCDVHGAKDQSMRLVVR